jgi:hypothetical protein
MQKDDDRRGFPQGWGGTRLLSSDELAAVFGGVVICYGPTPRPYPGAHDDALPVPPGGRMP